MKTLTSISLIALLATASFASEARHQGGKLIINNDSRDAVAAGGEVFSAQASASTDSLNGSLLYMSGQRAHAGSVIVNGCPCRKKTIVSNKSRGAMAIGAASAGSVVLNAGYGR